MPSRSSKLTSVIARFFRRLPLDRDAHRLPGVHQRMGPVPTIMEMSAHFHNRGYRTLISSHRQQGTPFSTKNHRSKITRQKPQQQHPLLHNKEGHQGIHGQMSLVVLQKQNNNTKTATTTSSPSLAQQELPKLSVRTALCEIRFTWKLDLGRQHSMRLILWPGARRQISLVVLVMCWFGEARPFIIRWQMGHSGDVIPCAGM